jgi:hypothetical protein
MPSCRHSGCDSSKSRLTGGNLGCDGIGAGLECCHNRSDSAAVAGRSTPADDAVTGQATVASWAEISTPDDEVTLRVPTECPELTPRASRALLAILVGLTAVPVVEGPGEGTRGDG